MKTSKSNPVKQHIREHHPVWERVTMAVETLAAGTDTIQERLASVYLHQLSDLKPLEFPEASRAEFIGILDDLSARFIPSNTPYNRVEVTDDEGRELAKRIFWLLMHIDSVTVLSDKLA